MLLGVEEEDGVVKKNGAHVDLINCEELKTTLLLFGFTWTPFYSPSCTANYLA